MHENSLAIDERRRHKRFRIKEDSSFVMTHDWPSLGKVVNISEGGFAFEYFANDKWADGDIYEGMLFGDNESCLNSLPFKIIQDLVISDGHLGSNTLLRRCCVQFGDLTKKQKFLLECFMWVNCTSEC